MRPHSWVAGALIGLALMGRSDRIESQELPAWASDTVRCPSKWGAEDQRGTMNELTPQRVAKAAQLVKTGQVYELGRPLVPNVPGAGGRVFSVVTMRTTGPTGITGRSGNEEMVYTPLGQIGTDLDGFAHVGIGDSYYNCLRLTDIQTRGGFKKLGIETVGTIFTRGILIDVAGAKGLRTLPPAYQITVPDLQDALNREHLHIEAGDAVLINVGWENLTDSQRSRDYALGTPGLGEIAGEWLAKQDPVLLGSDNDAVEMFSLSDAEDPHKVSLPVHQIALTVYGVHLLENTHLVQLAQDRVYEFLFVAQPLKIVGASGSTVAPTAIR